MNRLIFFSIFCCAFLPVVGVSQPTISLGYGGHLPMADLEDRFGRALQFSIGGILPVFNKGEVQARFAYGFGNRVKEDVLAGLRNRDGFIFGSDKFPADIQQKYRSTFSAILIARKLGKTPLHEVVVGLGPSYLTHKIRVQPDPQQQVPQINGDYRKGYDRLTAGFGITESVSYRYHSPSDAFHLEIAVFSLQHRTQHLRSHDFASVISGTLTPLTRSRTDIISGVEVRWLIPL